MLLLQCMALLLLPVMETFSQQVYFQQDVNYDIKVSLDDQKHVLNGQIQIIYKNNSRDTLQYIWMHLWPDAYRDRNTALSRQLLESKNRSLYFSKPDDRGFIDKMDFKVEAITAVLVTDSMYHDMGRLILNQPLLPGGEIKISTPFRVKIPSNRISRMGHNGNAYQISQWYPKPAVYDQSGWHAMPFLEQGEFYSEFGTFKVSITLPSNYVVAATGVLQETSEQQWLQKKVEETKAISAFDTSMAFPDSDTSFKTITFIQDKIHDFAWFADKRFHVLNRQIKVEGNDQPITCWTFFTNKKSELWKKSLDYIEDGVRYYSQRIGAYPYSDVSAVDGTISAGGGMEYPMVTIISTPSDSFELENTIVHEVGHNWFYGILGSNERENAWMDEGINSYYELEYTIQKYHHGIADSSSENTPGYSLGPVYQYKKLSLYDGFLMAFESEAFDNSDQAATTAAPELTYLNYGAVVYSRVALAFRFLEDYLGSEVFDRAMHRYFDTWKYMHPGPVDLQQIFENESGKKLDWFFSGLLGSTEPASYSVSQSVGPDHATTFEITNNGKVAFPVKVRIGAGAAHWYDGFTGTLKIKSDSTNGQELYVNEGYGILLKMENTRYSDSRILKSMPDLKVRFLPEIKPKENSETLLLLPLIAWNRYNNIMAGVVFSNFGIIPEKFEFTLAPLYDFENSDIAGTGSSHYSIWPMHGILKDIHFSLSGKRFAYGHNTLGDDSIDEEQPVFRYTRAVPGIEIKFRKKNPRSTLQHSVSFRNISIWQDEVSYTKKDSIYERDNVTSYLNFNELSWRMVNHRELDPYNAGVSLEQGDSYVKAFAEINYRFSYARRKKGVNVRLFAGGFIHNDSPPGRNYNFRMSGWEGSRDYLYDEIYFGRTDDHGLWKQQFVVRDGGFKIPTFVGQSNKWIAAMNIIADMPVPIPISVFADIGTYEGISDVFEDLNNQVMYDGGIAVILLRDIVEVYIPLFHSDDIDKAFEVNNITFAEQIRFVFNLNRITPQAIRNSSYDRR